jgi:hypothetical protein
MFYRQPKTQPKTQAKAAPKKVAGAANGSGTANGNGSGNRSGAANGRGRTRRGRNAGRGKPKTADELDAEMADYFESADGGASAAAPANSSSGGPVHPSNVQAAVNGGVDAGMDDGVLVSFSVAHLWRLKTIPLCVISFLWLARRIKRKRGLPADLSRRTLVKDIGDESGG